MKSPIDFGQMLNLAIQTRKMTQDDLAKRTGLEPSAISHFVKNRREPSFANLIKICEGLQMTPNELLGFEKIQFMRIEAYVPVPKLNDTQHEFSHHGPLWLVPLGPCVPDNNMDKLRGLTQYEIEKLLDVEPGLRR